MKNPDDDVTRLLDAWTAGDDGALHELVPLVIGDLRRLAASFLAGARNQTLQPTALVNEAYLRIVGRRDLQVEDRAQFFAYLARVMRHVLVDHARRKRSAKLGGDRTLLSFDEALDVPREELSDGAAAKAVDLLALDEVLRRLQDLDERQGRIVELRYFGGLTIEETAAALETSPRTVKREWRTARLWLLRELDAG